jgi:Icc-related predicted phosphoesterase
MKPALRLFYAADIHGSERVFRKFLNAAPFYRADAVIFGGDITGKAIVPLVEFEPGRYRAHVSSGVQEVDDGAALRTLESYIRDQGSYPYRTNPDEVAAMTSNPAMLKDVFTKVMRVTAERWVSLADERLRAAGIPALMMPGNDDEPMVRDLLAQGDWITDAEDRVVDLGGYQVVSFGCSTTTPWHSPREVSEEEMGRHLDKLTAQLSADRPVIFNFHNPPRDSGLDLAYKMTPDMRVEMAGGQPQLAAVGSTSVRGAIAREQPVLSLHGHIHESRGVAKVGRTIAINPGSAYSDGTLQGVVVALDGEKVVGQQFVTG